MLKQKKGFTLVELLTIICVIGLILGIAIPSANKILRNAKESKFIADSRTILSSVESYITENNYKIPDEGIALEDLDLDLKSLNGYTGVVKYDGNNVYLDSITNNELCGAGNKTNFEVYGDLSNCRIIAEDNGEWFELAKSSSVDFGYGIPVTGTENPKKLCYINFEDEEFDLKSIDYTNTDYAYCDIQSDQLNELVKKHL